MTWVHGVLCDCSSPYVDVDLQVEDISNFKDCSKDILGIAAKSVSCILSPTTWSLYLEYGFQLSGSL